MPRDLQAGSSPALRALTEEPPLQGNRQVKEDGHPGNTSRKDDSEDQRDGLPENLRKAELRNDLHPYVRPLTLADLESCVKLEEAAFPEHERTSREKIIYRFTKCGELSLGLFTSSGPDSATREASTAESANPTYSSTPNHKAIMLAHIIAAKCTTPVVTDDAMALPPDWESPSPKSDRLGHREEGRTLAIHALAVLPGYQRKGLGQTIVKSYVQRMEASGVADRVALLCHDHLIPFYESCGFENKGKSEAQAYGGGWNDMVLELEKIAPGQRLGG